MSSEMSSLWQSKVVMTTERVVGPSPACPTAYPR
jgi:hypothetical protein